MKRRHFIKAIGLASAAVVFAKDLFARDTKPRPFRHAFGTGLNVTLCESTDQNCVMADPNGGVIDCPECTRILRTYRRIYSPPPTIFKVTGLLIHIGQESAPYSVTANEDGYLTLPDLGNVDQYALYAPMPGFEQSGPWYLMRIISRREARRARFTIVAPTNYSTSDLAPKFCPRERESFTISLPQSDEDQTGWRIYGGDLNGPASVLIDVP